MKRKLTLLVLMAALGLYANATPPVEEGKTIFTSRCAGCHNVNKLVVGPALAGVDQRHSIDWIVNFVQSSQTVIKSGDKPANELFAKFKIVMPDHKDLTADNIKSVVEYIKSSAAAAATEAKATSSPEKTVSAWEKFSKLGTGFFVTLSALIVLLIWSLLFLIKVKAKVRALGK